MVYRILVLIILLAGYEPSLKAQQTPSDLLAQRISQRMKDSLSLTEAQKQSIYQVNLQLHNQKAGVWQQYSGSDSLIKVNLQGIENMRDSLYRPVLSEMQFELYRQKKRSLISSN